MINQTNKIIDGKAISGEIRSELKTKIAVLLNSKPNLRAPGLAVILVGDDPASHFYVNKKQEACREVGMESFKTVLPIDASADDVINTIEKYNADKNVDGILLQLPLPKTIRAQTQEILDHIQANKDVDGLTSYNLGLLLINDSKSLPEKLSDARLASPKKRSLLSVNEHFEDEGNDADEGLQAGSKTIYPCTPKGCMELLKRTGINLQGKRALVIGRSTLVGKPISLMLNQANATVIMAHSKTENLEKELSEADIVIAAIGVPEFIKGSSLKPGAVVIDVGINSVINSNGDKRIVGDVEYQSAYEMASFISPVPGGVGPMTVAMLLSNAWELYLREFGE